MASSSASVRIRFSAKKRPPPRNRIRPRPPEKKTSRLLPGSLRKRIRLRPPSRAQEELRGGTSTIAFTPGTVWHSVTAPGSATVPTTSRFTQTYQFDTQKVCGSKYCFQITGASATHAYAKLTKIDGKAFGSWPLEWNVANLSNSKLLATPLTSCDKAYTGQTEIQATLSLKYVTTTLPAQAQASFYSGTKCAEYETTAPVTIKKCD